MQGSHCWAWFNLSMNSAHESCPPVPYVQQSARVSACPCGRSPQAQNIWRRLCYMYKEREIKMDSFTERRYCSYFHAGHVHQVACLTEWPGEEPPAVHAYGGGAASAAFSTMLLRKVTVQVHWGCCALRENLNALGLLVCVVCRACCSSSLLSWL